MECLFCCYISYIKGDFSYEVCDKIFVYGIKMNRRLLMSVLCSCKFCEWNLFKFFWNFEKSVIYFYF